MKAVISYITYYILKKKIKKIIQRTKKGEYNTFEQTVIQKCCDVSEFKYYPLFCINEETWAALQTKLSPDEIIIDINIVRILEPFRINPDLLVCFTSNTGNYFFYSAKSIDIIKSSANLHLSFNISNIKELDFIIKPEHTFSLNKGVPGLAKIFLDNGKRIKISGCYSRFAENIKCYIENVNDEGDFRQTSWVKEKIETLYKKSKISEEKYKLLHKRLNITKKQANRLVYESLLYD